MTMRMSASWSLIRSPPTSTVTLYSVPLKTAASYRTIARPSLATDALKEQRRMHVEARLKAGDARRDNDLIFSTRHGEPIERQNAYRPNRQAMKRAGLPAICQHDFRHSVATLHLRGGESPKVVHEVLGHSTIGTTPGQCSHVLPTMHHAAADRLGAAFTYRPKKRA